MARPLGESRRQLGWRLGVAHASLQPLGLIGRRRTMADDRLDVDRQPRASRPWESSQPRHALGYLLMVAVHRDRVALPADLPSREVQPIGIASSVDQRSVPTAARSAQSTKARPRRSWCAIGVRRVGRT